MTRSRSSSISLALLGVWLVVSVFLWPHSSGQAALGLLGGLLLALLGLLHLRGWQRSEFMILAVSVWLGVGAIVLPERSTVSVFNHMLVAGAAIVFLWR
jgi:hypothetical protein